MSNIDQSVTPVPAVGAQVDRGLRPRAWLVTGHCLSGPDDTSVWQRKPTSEDHETWSRLGLIATVTPLYDLTAAPVAIMDTRDVLGLCAPTEEYLQALYALKGMRSAMREIRVEWRMDQKTGNGVWHVDTPAWRQDLERIRDECCSRYGAGTHWVAERAANALQGRRVALVDLGPDVRFVEPSQIKARLACTDIAAKAPDMPNSGMNSGDLMAAMMRDGAGS